MAGGTSSSSRRVAAAILKIDQFLIHLENIAETGFPHDDGRTALTDIRETFKKQRTRLLRIPSGASSELEGQFFRDVRDLVSIYTRVLGIILRSTNLRNNFEVYFPLKRLAKSLLGNDVRLLISSEWEFIPFTYPMNIKDVPNLILVGSPATEAQNLMVIPLAGHEIGHSVFAQRGILKNLYPIIEEKIEKFFKSNPSKKNRIAPSRDALGLDVEIAKLKSSLYLKIEETFCDLFGLEVFGVSYMLAFEYYMAPGKAMQSPTYPSDETRIRVLMGQCRKHKIEVPSDLGQSWEAPPKQDGEGLIYEVADEILTTLVDEISKEVDVIVQSSGIKLPVKANIDLIRGCFRRFEPYNDATDLPEIVCALWLESIDTEVTFPMETKRIMGLTEVALKSVEIAEYNSKTAAK